MVPVAKGEWSFDGVRARERAKRQIGQPHVSTVGQRHACVGPIRLIPFRLISSAVFTGRRQRELDLTRSVHVHRNRNAGEPFPKHGRMEESLPIGFDGRDHASPSAIGVVTEVVAVHADNRTEAGRGGRQPDRDLPWRWHCHAAFKALARNVKRPVVDTIALQHAGFEPDQQVRRRSDVICDAEKLCASPAPGVIQRLR